MLLYLLNYSYFRGGSAHVVVYSPILNYSGCTERTEVFLAFRLQWWPQNQGKGSGRFPFFLPSVGPSSCLICSSQMQPKASSNIATSYFKLGPGLQVPVLSQHLWVWQHDPSREEVTGTPVCPVCPARSSTRVWIWPGAVSWTLWWGLWADSRWNAQSLGTHQPGCTQMDFGSCPCQSSPAATSTVFKYSPGSLLCKYWN